MLITTENRMERAGTVNRLGPVNGEYVIEEKTFRGILAEMKEYEEIRTPAYEKELEKAKETVMNQMIKKAEGLGANAIIGLNIYHEIVAHGTMMLVAGKGIAAEVDESEV